MKNKRLLQLAFAAAIAGSSALAAPITWTINATLDDGATVTGSFVFNPDLGPFEIITNFNINISAATISTLTEPFDSGLPTSIFPAYDFTPANSTAEGPFANSQFNFTSNAFTYGGENLVLSFVPASPLTDASSTTITNSNIAVNNVYSEECFDCDPYVCFAGATGGICPSASVGTPEPGELPLVAFALGCVLIVRRQRDRRARPRFSADDDAGKRGPPILSGHAESGIGSAAFQKGKS
jgi:hypothetical protein